MSSVGSRVGRDQAATRTEPAAFVANVAAAELVVRVRAVEAVEAPEALIPAVVTRRRRRRSTPSPLKRTGRRRPVSLGQVMNQS